MTIVLADGTIAKTGGKVVKNVAGYDLHKLMTGSFGTLGVITEVNFRLHPVEEHARTWTVVATDAARSGAARFDAPLARLMDSQLTPSACNSATSQAANARWISASRPCPNAWTNMRRRIQTIVGQLAARRSGEAVWRRGSNSSTRTMRLF